MAKVHWLGCFPKQLLMVSALLKQLPGAPASLLQSWKPAHALLVYEQDLYQSNLGIFSSLKYTTPILRYPLLTKKVEEIEHM